MRCDAYHDGHTCDGAGNCRRALISMCERMSERIQSRSTQAASAVRSAAGGAGTPQP